MSPYSALNPFIATSVGEHDLWNAAALPDAPSIHAAAYDTLKSAVEQVRTQRRSQVRFVRGAGGSGKSHLFARLHRSCADGIFYAYAPNPPLQPEALEQFVLSRFVNSLRHAARRSDGTSAPYSQLRLLAYALLKPVVEQPYSFTELHEAWAHLSLESRKELIHEAVLLLEAEHPMVPRSVLRCLLNVLREDKEHLAAQWLSGAAWLTENELKYLGVPEPLRRGEVGLVIQLFGKLAAQAGAPVVLVLDQLDLITTPPQFDEMQRLLFMLIDQSENWLILIGLVAERFAMWDAALTQALRGRIGVPDAAAPLGFRLPVSDMLPISGEQKRHLLTCRLESPGLTEQRKRDNLSSAIHPLLEEDILRLTAGGAVFPRHLLAAAAELYTQRANTAPAAVASATTTTSSSSSSSSAPLPPPSTAKTPLSDKIDALLRQAQETVPNNSDTPSAVDLGERVRDLIELMAAAPVTITEGGMRSSYDNFDGTDRWFEWGGGKIRLVTSDATRSSFLAVLERLRDARGDTLLLRHTTVPVSGQLTLEMLDAFKAKNSFHHISTKDALLLDAVGHMLAAMREGTYEQLPTEPAASKDNILATLRSQPTLRALPLWQLIQKSHAMTGVPANATLPPTSSVLAALVRTSENLVKSPTPVRPPPPSLPPKPTV